MVEYSLQLDTVFNSLADPTRRDILQRVARCELSVGDLVRNYNVSFAAISKHIKVLEGARLVNKRKEGKKQMVSLAPGALRSVDEYLEQYRLIWQSRVERLDLLIKEEDKRGRCKSN